MICLFQCCGNTKLALDLLCLCFFSPSDSVTFGWPKTQTRLVSWGRSPPHIAQCCGIRQCTKGPAVNCSPVSFKLCSIDLRNGAGVFLASISRHSDLKYIIPSEPADKRIHIHSTAQMNICNRCCLTLTACVLRHITHQSLEGKYCSCI